MDRVESRRRLVRRWKVTPRFWTVLGIAVLLSIAASYAAVLRQAARLEARIAEVHAKIAATEASIEAKRAELEYLQSDQYIERVAREQLGLVMPGEIPVKLAAPAGNSSPSGAR
ncbi:MAG: septum formation initiator family protein [Clostridia bacterium]|nr:hypothetical protein [Bacillota bacterium]MBO2521094.1 hypothetical protein [Bacillota bacterium]